MAEKKGWRRALCTALLFIAGAACLWQALPVRADTVTQESIRQKEESIQSAKDEREQMQSNLSDLKKVKEQLQASKDDLTGYITQIDANLTQMQGKIDDLKSKITDKEAEIEKTEAELEAAQEQQQEQYEAMKQRIRFMYERGSNVYLELLFENGGFGGMLNKAVYVEQIAQYDREKLDEYAQQVELVSLTKESLEQEKETLNTAKANVEQEEVNMQSLLAEKKTQVASVEGDLENQNATIAEYEAQVAQQNAEIQALEAAVAAEKEQLAAQNKPQQTRTYDGGMFAWPAPSYTYISSEFGYRTHPIYGDSRFHNGLDMAAPGGSPILAAYDGAVVAAAYSSSMGNYVMLDHGDGLYTIYMHASALYVSKGQSVSKGEQIAAVGSTGNSTGNHLHFSVRLNGSYVSPWNYLG